MRAQIERTDRVAERPARRRALATEAVLPLILLSLGLVVSAVPALNVALPDLASDTGATMSQLQWIVDAYALVFAALLLPAGAVGDRYGRKRVLVWGLALFALGSRRRGDDLDAERADRVPRHHGSRRCARHARRRCRSSRRPCPRIAGARPSAAWVGVAGAGAILGLVAAGAAPGGLGLGLGVLVVRRRWRW